ncbi:hypothetical protein [Bradyrhizobium sp. Ec3.3]|uniref:hypothetical protein n=1 Tax=Bradyrhizobium sp. Ec3.3 TaxID=189753 RepID=UPI0012EC0D4E|nr:hypothetical protein [Bradyrhizobium sp. Ec3.3]
MLIGLYSGPSKSGQFRGPVVDVKRLQISLGQCGHQASNRYPSVDDRTIQHFDCAGASPIAVVFWFNENAIPLIPACDEPAVEISRRLSIEVLGINPMRQFNQNLL